MDRLTSVFSRFSQWLYGGVGLVLGIGIWWLMSHLHTGFLIQQLRPEPSFQQLLQLLQTPLFYEHMLASLHRIVVGLTGALLIGLPIGLVMGSSPLCRRLFTPLFQFLRMISPLSWMPIAVMAFGVGDAPIYFLLIFAGLWPILLNTAQGVEKLNPRWRLLSRSLNATRWEFLRYILFPAIRHDVFTGCRLAVGVLWIVLVPCEMLGVNAGLGYLILDTRDRLAYAELMAVILCIGVLGYTLDSLCRLGLSRHIHT